MDGPRGYYAKCSMSDRERQIPYGFTYTWNLTKQMNNQNKIRLVEIETKGMVTRKEGVGGWVTKVRTVMSIML